MEQAKLLKKSDEQQAIYQEIIIKLMNDKAELELIAGEYKSRYEKVNISDDDIEHLQSSLERLAEILKNYGVVPVGKDEDVRMVIDLFNKDTLKTAQLLGFNYREAIGEPLTIACANVINNKVGNTRMNQSKKGRK